MGTRPTPLARHTRRVLPTLAVVFAVLASSGWLPRGESAEPGGYPAQLEQWRQDEIAGVPLPDPEADPATVADWFDGTGHRKQELLADRYPLVVGNLDGVPPEIRYRANRAALTEARERERDRLSDDRLSAAGRENAARLLHRFDSLLRADRQILAFDPTGGGRVAEVFGDLTSAERVSVVVPGVHTDLLTFERTRQKYRAPAGMAEALYEEQRAVAPDRETAVIAWADYTTPNGLGVSAATGDLAEEGADRLADAVSGLPAAADVGLFCHSYGSVVCGVAAPELPDRVTDIAVAGSPGMRVSDVGELGSAARVWAARAPDDWVGGVPSLAVGPLGHGRDPIDPAFGATTVLAERADGHDGYFVPGTDSLAGFARIGAGTVDPADVDGGARPPTDSLLAAGSTSPDGVSCGDPGRGQV